MPTNSVVAETVLIDQHTQQENYLKSAYNPKDRKNPSVLGLLKKLGIDRFRYLEWCADGEFANKLLAQDQAYMLSFLPEITRKVVQKAYDLHTDFVRIYFKRLDAGKDFVPSHQVNIQQNYFGDSATDIQEIEDALKIIKERTLIAETVDDKEDS